MWPFFWSLDSRLGPLPMRDQPVRRIVRRNAHRNPVTHEHADFELFHSTGEPGRHDGSAVQLNGVAAAGRIHDFTFCAD